MNRVKKTIVYLLAAAAAFALWYSTTPQNFSKDKLVDAYLRGYHAGPAKATLVEYGSQSGSTFRIAECDGETYYAFVMQSRAGLWSVENICELTIPEGDYNIKYMPDSQLFFGRIKNPEAEQVHFVLSVRYSPGRWEMPGNEGEFVVTGTADVDEKGCFYTDFYDELTAGGKTNLWHTPLLQMIVAFDGEGNQLWSYQYDENKRENISIR